MKKVVSLFLMVMLLVTLFGCNEESSTEQLIEKQTPIYTGMTIEYNAETAQVPSERIELFSNTNNGKGNDGDNGNHTGQENGNSNNVTNGDNLNLDGGEYYTSRGEEIYIHIHFDNPDNFEILSFTINGQKYSSYMFEDGSDMETIIIKKTVGLESGTYEYTIDEIKYVDETKIKFAIVKGSQTIKVHVSDAYDGSRGLKYTLLENGTYAVAGIGTCEDTELVIPQKHKGIYVTHIFDCAFTNNELIKSVVIPDSVISIGYRAFMGCDSLYNVTIPNSVTVIEERAFCCCESLPSITIPDSVTYIGYNAFAGCSKLTTADLGNGISEIIDDMFADCTSLQTIYIPDSVKSIGSCAFYNCKSLEDLKIPSCVTTIGPCAFEWCDSLKSITIPNSVTSIDRSAFQQCSSLKMIEFCGTIEQWNAISKHTDWDYNTGDYIIYCADAAIAKDGTVRSYPIFSLIVSTGDYFAWYTPIHLKLRSDGFWVSPVLTMNDGTEFKIASYKSYHLIDFTFGLGGEMGADERDVPSIVIRESGNYIVEFYWDGISNKAIINLVRVD